MLHKNLILLVSLLFLLITTGGAVAAKEPAKPSLRQPTGSFEPAPCMFEMPLVSFMTPEQYGFECGYVTVPEQHADPTGPTIRLPVAIHHATAENTKPDPLFLAQGGPGGDAFGVFAFAFNYPAAQDRDIVIFNQRGTLYAEPSLICHEVFDRVDQSLALPPNEAISLENEAYAQCRRRLQAEGINLSAYNSLENAADVEAIRQALGYNKINFYGVSYGTLLALHLMRNYPDHLRTVILDGVVPTQLNFIPLIPQVTERIFAEMFNACAADATCSANYPNLEQRFSTLIDQLNKQPVTIPVTNPDTLQTVDVFVDGTTLMNMLFEVFYGPEMYAVFPKLIDDFETGDYSFWQIMWPLFTFDRTMSEGMFLSVICAEDADFDPAQIPLEGVRPQIAASAADDMQEYLNQCHMWQVNALPPSVDDPVASNIPTLLLSGQFDPITPPSFAAAAAQYLANGYSVVDPTSSHGTAFGNSCIDQIVQNFLDAPTHEPNTSCLQEKSPSGFVSPNALTIPLLSKLNMPDTMLAVQLGASGLFLMGILSAFIIWPLNFIINQLRNRHPDASPDQKRWGRVSKGLVMLFGALAMLFVSGTATFLAQAIVSTPLLMLSAVSEWAAPLFVLPFLLALLSVVMVFTTVQLWRKRIWSIWGRLYYTILLFCAIGYVVMLGITRMMFVLV